MERPKRGPRKPPKVKWYTPTEAARIIGRSTEWLRKKRESGDVYAEILENGRWGFPDFEVERLQLRTPPRLLQEQQ